MKISNKCFIRRPAKGGIGLDLIYWSSTLRGDVYGSGMMDKTMMYEAAGWHEICYMGKVSTFPSLYSILHIFSES